MAQFRKLMGVCNLHFLNKKTHVKKKCRFCSKVTFNVHNREAPHEYFICHLKSVHRLSAAFPGGSQGVPRSACPRSSHEHPNRRHPNRMPEPTHLALLNMEEQQSITSSETVTTLTYQETHGVFTKVQFQSLPAAALARQGIFAQVGPPRLNSFSGNPIWGVFHPSPSVQDSVPQVP